jgi:hypothetical protein
MTHAGDDAERGDEEERRITPAGDDAERGDKEERRAVSRVDLYEFLGLACPHRLEPNDV